MLLKMGVSIRARLDNDGVNSLPGEFVVVGFREGFQCEFAGAIKTKAGDDNAACATADVHE